MKKQVSPAPQNNSPSNPPKKSLLLQLLFFCAAFAIIYFWIAPKFPYIFYIYVAIAVIIGFAYVIYNRGLTAKGLTPEMLPDTMSASEKQEFIENGKLRLRRSRWMLMILFPTIFTVACDMFYLFVIEGFAA